MKSKRLAPIDEMMPLIIERIDTGGNVSFTPMGISMYPMLRHGMDSVVLAPVREKLKKYDVILYRRSNGKYVLHRIINAGNTYTCIGDNQYRKEQGIKPDQVIAVVIAFTHKGKEYSVDYFGYKLYCRIWHYTRFLRRMSRGFKKYLKTMLKGEKENGR